MISGIKDELLYFNDNDLTDAQKFYKNNVELLGAFILSEINYLDEKIQELESELGIVTGTATEKVELGTGKEEGETEIEVIEEEIEGGEALEEAPLLETETIVDSEYNIGDTGPAGGYIFYINPNYEQDGWRYLEAAPSNQSNGLQWYNGNYQTTGATSIEVGSGKSNTEKIISVQGSGNYAAYICNNLNINGYSDWFLPSKDELNLMYENLYAKGLVNFKNGYCWSSSELDEKRAWLLDFSTGWHGNGSNKLFDACRVRAVRAF